MSRIAGRIAQVARKKMEEQKEVINAIQRNTKYLEEKLKWINDDISWKDITNELNNTRLAMKVASINYNKLYNDWKKKKEHSDALKEENRQRKLLYKKTNDAIDNHREQEFIKHLKENESPESITGSSDMFNIYNKKEELSLQGINEEKILLEDMSEAKLLLTDLLLNNNKKYKSTLELSNNSKKKEIIKTTGIKRKLNEIVNEDNVELSTIQPIIDTIEECKPEEEKKLLSEENVLSDKKKKSLIKNNIPNITSREYRAAKRFHGIKNTFKPNEIIELDDDNDSPKFTMNNISELEKIKVPIHLRNKLLCKFSEKKF